MSAILTIRDGDPYWWNSPDIWVVPGGDPGGVPGVPIAGSPAFLWARAHNTGDQAVTGAKIDFYWSNPATGVLRSNSHLVGSPYVDLEAGETQDVLCLVPWIPEIVNDGHECLVAEIIHPADPLPSPPLDAFDPPTYRQIAQKNLDVLQTQTFMIVKAIQIGAPKRIAQRLAVAIEIGGEIDDLSLGQLGLKGFRPAKPAKGFSALLAPLSGCDDSGEDRLEFSLDPGEARAAYLKIRPCEIEKNHYLPVHVISRDDRGIVGGITFLLVSGKED